MGENVYIKSVKKYVVLGVSKSQQIYLTTSDRDSSCISKDKGAGKMSLATYNNPFDVSPK